MASASRIAKAVRFLAGRAAGRPEAQLAAGLGLVDEARQELGPDLREELRIAEELGDLDQEARGEPVDLIGVTGRDSGDSRPTSANGSRPSVARPGG